MKEGIFFFRLLMGWFGDAESSAHEIFPCLENIGN
jgi:hypothetical protein